MAAMFVNVVAALVPLKLGPEIFANVIGAIELKHRPDTNIERAHRTEWQKDWDDVARCVTLLVWHPDFGDIASFEATPEQETDAFRIRDRLEEEARALVPQHWPAIERVARALLQRRTLTGAELDEIINDEIEGG